MEVLTARHLYFLKVDESHESYWRACEGLVTKFKPHPRNETRLFFSQIPNDYLRHFSLACLFESRQNFPLRVSTPAQLLLRIAIMACSLFYFQVDKRQLS